MPFYLVKPSNRVESSQINKLYVTDTIPLGENFMSDKISVRTAADLFAESIVRSNNNESVSSLFEIDKG
jgi:ribose-phosphate pyrophosphokinase